MFGVMEENVQESSKKKLILLLDNVMKKIRQVWMRLPGNFFSMIGNGYSKDLRPRIMEEAAM